MSTFAVFECRNKLFIELFNLINCQNTEEEQNITPYGYRAIIEAQRDEIKKLNVELAEMKDNVDSHKIQLKNISAENEKLRQENKNGHFKRNGRL